MRNYSRFFNQHLICSIDDNHKVLWRFTKNIEDLFTLWIATNKLLVCDDQELEEKTLFIHNAAYILLSQGKGHIFVSNMQEKIRVLGGEGGSLMETQEIIDIAASLYDEGLAENGRYLFQSAMNQ